MAFAQRLIATRRGSTILGIVAAVLAGAIVLVYLNQYRSSIHSTAAPVTVLVAKHLIQQGTPGDLIGSTKAFQTSSIPKDQVKAGALTDASTLQGRVAATDIYAGQQLAAGDFVPAAHQILTKLPPNMRAVSVPVDAAHGIVSELAAGDHVDVYAALTVSSETGGGSVPVVKLLARNTLVLQTPKKAAAGVGATAASNIILRATAPDAAQFAFTADNGKLWIVLRPTNARTTPPSLVTAESLVLGLSPVVADARVKAILAGATR
jgi:Flp pilus assembly protein CpaB